MSSTLTNNNNNNNNTQTINDSSSLWTSLLLNYQNVKKTHPKKNIIILGKIKIN